MRNRSRYAPFISAPPLWRRAPLGKLTEAHGKEDAGAALVLCARYVLALHGEAAEGVPDARMLERAGRLLRDQAVWLTGREPQRRGRKPIDAGVTGALLAGVKRIRSKHPGISERAAVRKFRETLSRGNELPAGPIRSELLRLKPEALLRRYQRARAAASRSAH